MTLQTESGIPLRLSIQPSVFSCKSDYHFVHFIDRIGLLKNLPADKIACVYHFSLPVPNPAIFGVSPSSRILECNVFD